METTRVINCNDGVAFSAGKFFTEISNSTISNNSNLGIYISYLSLGRFNLHNNVISLNTNTNIAHLGGAGYRFEVDGAVFPQTGSLCEYRKEAWRKSLVAERSDRADKLLSLQRHLKAAGDCKHAPKCNKCKAKEPKDKKFQKCGLCGGVVYCSKDCQRVDWAAHKLVCKA
jgi:hypothetical protein